MAFCLSGFLINFSPLADNIYYNMEYELMWLVADTKKEDLPRLKKEINDIVTKASGVAVGETIEFEQKLSYQIKHNWKGIYVAQRFTLKSKDEREENNDTTDAVGEMTRQLNLHKELLRYIIVSAEDLPSLASFAKDAKKAKTEDGKVFKEKGEKIDGKLEKVLNI